MSVGRRALSALGRLGIIIAVAAAFLFGLGGTIWLSLRTTQVKVPDIVGKDFLTAETVLANAGLNVRKRASRPSTEKPNIVLDQLPRAGDVVKEGQTIAVDVTRTPKEGEYVPSAETETKPEVDQKNENGNANAASTANNQNNSNQNRNRKSKNTNKNANNSNNSNNSNANRNANNRNAPSGNNTNNRTGNANRNANANSGGNRNAPNSNTNRRPPSPTTQPSPGTNRRAPGR